MRRGLQTATGLVLAAGVLTGCGSTTADSDGRHSSRSQSRSTVGITIDRGTVTGGQHRVTVPAGNLIRLSIHADDTGEVHVHSSPEKTIEYHPGTTQAYLGRFTAPRRITVQSGSPAKTVLILDVQ